MSVHDFCLNAECLNYLLCNYCCEPLTESIYVCSGHTDIKICADCQAKNGLCCYCQVEMSRNPSLETMLGMISHKCEGCGQFIKFTEQKPHRANCVITKYYCAFEVYDMRCSVECNTVQELFKHYKYFHGVPEYHTTNSTIALPHAQIHTNLRDVEKPVKDQKILPMNCSLCYICIVQINEVSVLLEFFFNSISKSFVFTAKSDPVRNVSVLVCIPQFSLFGVANGLKENGVEVVRGKTHPFAKNVPLHMNNSIKNIGIAEFDVFEVFEKYSFLHADARYIQFGLELN